MKQTGRNYSEIEEAIERFDETGNWIVEDCTICDNGAVYHGLIQIIEPY